MKKIIISFSLLFLCAITFAQSDLSERTNELIQQINEITTEEKAMLKARFDEIADQLENKEISKSTAAELRSEAAEESAERIGERIAEIQDQITELIAEQVESEMEFEEETAVTIEEMEEELEREMEEMEEDMEEAESEWEEDDSDWSDDDDSDWSDDEDDDSEDDDDDFDIRIKRGDINFGHHRRGESRHTSQFVLAFGFNTLIANRDFSTINDSPVRAFNSKSFEWGFTGKQRMIKDNNLLHFKYGISFVYNTFTPLNNGYYVVEGNQTVIREFPNDLSRSRLNNLYFNVPVHLEFDFSKPRQSRDGTRTIYRTQEAMRLGFGGFVGVRVRSKQTLRYSDNGHRIEQESRGDFNVNQFTYGLSAYLGYKDAAIFAKYDLNNLFVQNDVDQNVFNVGIRFDLN